MKLKNCMTMMVAALTMAACSNDDVTTTPDPVKSQMTVDASDYGKWVYIDLKTGKTETVRDFSAWNYLTDDAVVETVPAQGSEKDVTIDWQIAIHRYDIKTNGGSAVATAETSFDKVTTMPASGYVADETVENIIITDMSGMMDSKIGYSASGNQNAVLNQWLKKTATGAMPPYIYEPTNLIYVVKCKDGSYAKLKFTDNTNAEGKSGHVTFSYEYIAQ